VTIAENPYRHTPSPSVTPSSRWQTNLQELTQGEIPLDHPCEVETHPESGKTRVTMSDIPWDKRQTVPYSAWETCRHIRWLGGEKWTFWYTLKPEKAGLA
jgi:hypothetical protein